MCSLSCEHVQRNNTYNFVHMSVYTTQRNSSRRCKNPPWMCMLHFNQNAKKFRIRVCLMHTSAVWCSEPKSRWWPVGRDGSNSHFSSTVTSFVSRIIQKHILKWLTFPPTSQWGFSRKENEWRKENGALIRTRSIYGTIVSRWLILRISDTQIGPSIWAPSKWRHLGISFQVGSLKRNFLGIESTVSQNHCFRASACIDLPFKI